MLLLEAVSQVDEQEKVFISRVFTVPKLERGIEYGKRFILNLKVSGFYTAPEQRYDRIASDPILLVFLLLGVGGYWYIRLHRVLPLILNGTRVGLHNSCLY